MAKVGRRNPATKSAVPVGLIVGIVAGVLAIGGIAALSYRAHLDRPCTPTGDHEHAAFAVYAQNRSVVWAGDRWDYPNAGSLAGHIHKPNWHTIHMESATACITVASFFQTTLQSLLTKKQLTLDHLDHAGTDHVDGVGGDHLRFFLGLPSGNWTFATAHGYQNATDVDWAEEPNLINHQPRDGQYFLVTYGQSTPQEIAYQEHSIPKQIQTE